MGSSRTKMNKNETKSQWDKINSLRNVLTALQHTFKDREANWKEI